MGYLQDYSKSKKIDFENALRATVLKIQPCALVGISFSHQAVPVANLGQIRQHHIFLKFSHFNAAKSSLGGISTKKRESALKLCRLVALLPLNGFWPDISLFFASGTGLRESSVAFLDLVDGSASRRPQPEMRLFRRNQYALFPICRGGKIFEIEYTSTWLGEKAKVAKMAAPGPGDRRGSSQ